MIFNTLQTSCRRAGAQSPSLESHDFNQPWAWEFASKSADKCQQGPSGPGSESAQYLSICIDS